MATQLTRHQITHERVQGTVEYWPKTDEQRITAFRNIVEKAQYAKVDGVMVDLFSASAVTQVYDALNPINRVKFSILPAYRMVEVAFRLIGKT
jgi:hypothetical protein